MLKRGLIISRYLLPVMRGAGKFVAVADEAYGKSMVYAPMVGGFIGLLCAFVYGVATIFIPVYLTPAFVIFCYLALTCGRHFEGFAFLSATKANERSILPQLIAALSIVTMYFCISATSPEKILPAIFIFPILGRFVLAASYCVMGAGDRTVDGSDTPEYKFMRHCDWVVFVIISVMFFAAAGYFYRLYTLLIYFTAVIFCYIMALASYSKSVREKAAFCDIALELSQLVFIIAIAV